MNREIFAISGTGIPLNERFSKLKPPIQTVKAVFNPGHDSFHLQRGQNFDDAQNWNKSSIPLSAQLQKGNLSSRLGRISVKNRLSIQSVNATLSIKNNIKKVNMASQQNISSRLLLRGRNRLTRQTPISRGTQSYGKIKGARSIVPQKRQAMKNKQMNMQKKQARAPFKGKKTIRNGNKVIPRQRITRNTNPKKIEQVRTHLDSELDNYMSVSRGRLDKDIDSYMLQTNDNIKKTHYI